MATKDLDGANIRNPSGFGDTKANSQSQSMNSPMKEKLRQFPNENAGEGLPEVSANTRKGHLTFSIDDDFTVDHEESLLSPLRKCMHEFDKWLQSDEGNNKHELNWDFQVALANDACLMRQFNHQISSERQLPVSSGCGKEGKEKDISENDPNYFADAKSILNGDCVDHSPLIEILQMDWDSSEQDFEEPKDVVDPNLDHSLNNSYADLEPI